MRPEHKTRPFSLMAVSLIPKSDYKFNEDKPNIFEAVNENFVFFLLQYLCEKIQKKNKQILGKFSLIW